MHPIGLSLAGAAAVGFAVLMLFQKTLYSAAACLMMVLLQVAVMFLLCGAELLGLLQILLYAGAVMVMIVVAVMVSPSRLGSRWAELGVRPLVAVDVVAVLLVELLWVWSIGPYPGALPQGPAAAGAPQADLAALLFGRYAVMTEAVGLLVLLAALAVVELGDEAEGA